MLLQPLFVIELNFQSPCNNFIFNETVHFPWPIIALLLPIIALFLSIIAIYCFFCLLLRYMANHCLIIVLYCVIWPIISLLLSIIVFFVSIIALYG